MQVTVQKLSPVLVEFDVQIEADAVKKEIDKAYSDVSRTARVRGFRPGRAPRSVLAHMFGRKIAADVAKRLVDETFPQAVGQQKLQPVTAPAIESQKLTESGPFTYKARFEIVPEITGVKYDGLQAKRPKASVSDEQVGEELFRLRRAHATLEPVSPPRPADTGDVVTVDFTVEVDGKAVPEAQASDLQIELGSGQILPGVEQALTGRDAGADLEVTVDMPERHPNPALRGRAATFHLALKDVKARVLPEADDEFAKDLGDFETLDALRADIRTRLEKRAADDADTAVAEQLVNALVQANPIPVPPSLVERQARMTEEEILQRARSQGQPATGLGEELRAKVVAESEGKVRAGLLMAEVAKAEKIRITEEHIEEGLKELAEQTGKNVAKLRVEYRDAKKREMLIGMILENKVLDIIESKAKIEDA
ncbi:MAG: trigger factor [Polyangiaceae bacterium]|nr:trigger factor [Polyangiaceae bacterium]